MSEDTLDCRCGGFPLHYPSKECFRKHQRVVAAVRKALSSLENPHDDNVIAERHLREALRDLDTTAEHDNVSKEEK